MIAAETEGSLTTGVLLVYVEDVRPLGTGAWRKIHPDGGGWARTKLIKNPKESLPWGF